MHRLVLALLGVVLLAGCGADAGPPGPVDASRDEGSSTGFGSEVTAIRAAGDKRLELTIVTDYQDRRCSTNPQARLERESGTVYITATFDAVPADSPDR